MIAYLARGFARALEVVEFENGRRPLVDELALGSA